MFPLQLYESAFLIQIGRIFSMKVAFDHTGTSAQKLRPTLIALF